jgi:hypothetical protein
VGDEQAADDPVERDAVAGRQPFKHGRDIRGEPSRRRGHQRPPVRGERDVHRPPVVRRRHAGDEAAPLRPVHQAGDTRLVEVKQPGQLVHGRLAIPQHAEQPRRRDRQVVLVGSPLQHAHDEERELSQPVHRAKPLLRSGRHAAILVDLVRVTN